MIKYETRVYLIKCCGTLEEANKFSHDEIKAPFHDDLDDILKDHLKDLEREGG